MFGIFGHRDRFLRKSAALLFGGRKGAWSFAVSDDASDNSVETVIRECLERDGCRVGMGEDRKRYVGIEVMPCGDSSKEGLCECRLVALMKIFDQYCSQLDLHTGELIDGVAAYSNVTLGCLHFVSEDIKRQGEHIEIIRLAIREKELARFYRTGIKERTTELTVPSGFDGLVARLAEDGITVRVLREALATRKGIRASALRELEESERRVGATVDGAISILVNGAKEGCDYAVAYEIVV